MFCHICGFPALEVAKNSAGYMYITSDCKPWRKGGSLATCPNCETVQAVITSRWRAEVKQIYKSYEVYHQGGGAEQAVFGASGQSDVRSNRLISRLSGTLHLPETGCLLDIGCGNGTFLRAFGSVFPGWILSGAEFDAKHHSDLKQIPGFSRLHTGLLDRISGRFDLVVLVHTLEHIEAPLVFLRAVRDLLSSNGFLFVQVPHYPENPFELMTFDHASHFDACSLASLLSRAGFVVSMIATDWVGRELSLVAQAGDSKTILQHGPATGWNLEQCLDWIDLFLDKAKNAQTSSSTFGLFGSSIAATWTAANLPRLPDFFVDEDPARAGRKHLDRPILNPRQVPADSTVFVALQPSVACGIMQRHSQKNPGTWQM